MSFKLHLLIERWHEYASRFKHMLVIFEFDLMKTALQIYTVESVKVTSICSRYYNVEV